MTEKPLEGVGVLVTRPRTQAAELVSAIEQQGGEAFCFPVIDIVALDENELQASEAALPPPDVTIFISRNAVEYGLRYSGGGRIAVIGPATAKAVRAAGRIVDIEPAAGYDSEHLLAEPELSDIAGKQVRIIRGSKGRELLSEELTARGATVNYLSVYERRLPNVPPDMLAELETHQGEIEERLVAGLHPRGVGARRQGWRQHRRSSQVGEAAGTRFEESASASNEPQRCCDVGVVPGPGVGARPAAAECHGPGPLAPVHHLEWTLG